MTRYNEGSRKRDRRYDSNMIDSEDRQKNRKVKMIKH